MANPQPDLQGFADPEVPGWEQRALERIRKRQTKTKRWTDRPQDMRAQVDPPFRVMLDAAANKRGIAMAGYIRRAVAAMIAHDLGVPFEDVVHHSAKPWPYEQPGRKGEHAPVGGATFGRGRTHDDGKDFGPWVINKLEGE